MLYFNVFYNQINISRKKMGKTRNGRYNYPCYCVANVDPSIDKFDIGLLSRNIIFGPRSKNNNEVSINISALIDSGINIYGRPCENITFFRIVNGEVWVLDIEDFAHMDLIHNCYTKIRSKYEKNERFNRIKLSIVSFKFAIKNFDEINMDIYCVKDNIVEIFDTFATNWGQIPPKILLQFICDYDLVAKNIKKLVQYEWFMRLLPKKVCGLKDISLCFELMFFAKDDVVIDTLIAHGALHKQNLGKNYKLLKFILDDKIKKYYAKKSG